MLMLEVRNPDGSWPRKVELKLCVCPNTNDIKLWSFDAFDIVGKSWLSSELSEVFINKIGNVIEKIRELFNLSKTTECRLWKCYMTNSYELLTNLTQTLLDAGIYGGQVLWLITILLLFLLYFRC